MHSVFHILVVSALTPSPPPHRARGRADLRASTKGPALLGIGPVLLMRDRVEDRGRRGRPRSPRRSRSRSPPRRREDRDRDRGRENFDRRDRRDRDEREREHGRENRQRERERERKRDATRRRSPSPERRRPPSIAEKYDSLFEGASWYAGLGDGIGGEVPASAPAPAEPGAAADEPPASSEAADSAPPDVESLKLSLLQGFLMDLVRRAPALAGPPLLGQRAPIPRSALALTLPSCSLWRHAPRREVELPPRRHRHRRPHRRRTQEAQWRQLTRRLAWGARRAERRWPAGRRARRRARVARGRRQRRRLPQAVAWERLAPRGLVARARARAAVAAEARCGGGGGGGSRRWERHRCSRRSGSWVSTSTSPPSRAAR